MKNVIYVLFCLLALDCSNKYESIVESAPQQRLSFNKDTIAIREKDYTNILYSNNGRLTLYCSDPAHELNLMRDDTNSVIHVMYRGEDIVTGKYLPVTDSVQVFVTADQPGLFSLSFYLTDRLSRVTNKNVPIKVFANQSATASFFYRMEEKTQLQSWPFYFDASLSFKPDGVITNYHYLINGQAVDSRDPVIRWIFHAKGEHIVGLYVTDDLNQNSSTIYQKIKIP